MFPRENVVKRLKKKIYPNGFPGEVGLFQGQANGKEL
jgi:hypothetical protein